MDFPVRVKGTSENIEKETKVTKVYEDVPVSLRKEESVGNKQQIAQKSRGSGRPWIVPDWFEGKELWKYCLEHFESCKIAYAWDDEETAAFLARVSSPGTKGAA